MRSTIYKRTRGLFCHSLIQMSLWVLGNMWFADNDWFMFWIWVFFCFVVCFQLIWYLLSVPAVCVLFTDAAGLAETHRHGQLSFRLWKFLSHKASDWIGSTIHKLIVPQNALRQFQDYGCLWIDLKQRQKGTDDSGQQHISIPWKIHRRIRTFSDYAQQILFCEIFTIYKPFYERNNRLWSLCFLWDFWMIICPIMKFLYRQYVWCGFFQDMDADVSSDNHFA